MDISKWTEIKDGKVKDIDFNKWYEEKLAEIIKGIEKDKEFSGDVEVLKKILKPIPFKSDIAKHIKYFTGREWILEKYNEWLKEFDSRLLWITAGPGFGKTAVAANLVNELRRKLGERFTPHMANGIATAHKKGSIVFLPLWDTHSQGNITKQLKNRKYECTI